MSFWVLIVLCIVQGLTEFLPVSSSGHLLFMEQIFNVSGNLLFLNLFLHIATLLAVVIVYRKIIWELIKKPFQKYTLKLLIATLCTLVFAFAYEYFNVDSIVTKIYCFGFLATSILLFFCHRFQKKSASIMASDEISMKNSVLVGVVQGFAVVPGLSRSGSTISSLILSGNDEKKSAEFSFLLSIPIIVGGFVLELIKILKNDNNLVFFDIKSYIFAFFLTFIVSLFALKITIKLLKNQKFIVFSIYTFLMFVVTFILNFLV